MRASSSRLWVAVFGLVATTHCLIFYLVPLFVPLVTGGLVFILGVTAVTASVVSFRRAPSRLGGTPLFLCLAIFAAWMLLPTRHLGEVIRFMVDDSTYQVAVDQWREGKRLSCLDSGDCDIDSKYQDYLIFPYPGILPSWIGVVYTSTGTIGPDFSFRSDAHCESAPLDNGFYLCSFY
jgi:hypothetical protein